MDLLRYLFFGGTSWVFCILSSLPDLKLRPYWKKVWKASWVSFFLMIRGKKCLSSSFLSGFCEVRRKVQPQGWFERVIQSSSGHLWKSQFSSCSHTSAFPCSAPFTERSLLGSSLLSIFLWPGLLEPSRRKCKWPTWAYVQDSLLKPRGGIYFQSNLLVAPPEAED